ncbi:MAG TPA: Lrp/AsnC family transcriptional regulator [Anaerolineales bacterium]|nr:Lrp/AsnC family transcriptional regulator [Anaerolineales bacterium]
MKLTRRQETFVHRLLDLYRELNGPIHYSMLAERVGVSPFTAYDMLRVLEEKGLVKSEYRLDSDKPVAGRSEVVFLPTERAHQLFIELAGDADQGNWENVKTQIMEKIRGGGLNDHVLAEEILARVPPDVPDVLRYCIEVMTIVILRLGKGAGRRVLAEHLPQIIEWKGTVTRSGLMLLGGFTLGLLANESNSDVEWNKLFLEHIRRYQSLVMDMEPLLCRRLGDSMKDVFAPIFKA